MNIEFSTWELQYTAINWCAWYSSVTLKGIGPVEIYYFNRINDAGADVDTLQRYSQDI